MLTQAQIKIQEAFIELIHKKDFNKISVSDISQSSNTNRGTFYLYYLDKYDLLEKIEQAVLLDLKEISTTHHTIELVDELIDPIVMTKTLEYMKQNLKIIQALILVNRSQSNDIIKAAFRYLLQSKLQLLNRLDISFPIVDQPYIESIITAVVTSIIYVWIGNEAIESCESITKTIIKALYTAPIQLIQFEAQ